MSCLAGVGGDINGFVVAARDCDILVAIDGCPVNCAKACFDRHKIEVDVHVTLTKEGFKKVVGADPGADEVARATSLLTEKIAAKKAALAKNKTCEE